MKKRYFLVLSWFLANTVLATGFSQWGTINQTYTTGSWTMVALSGNDENPDDCPADYYYAIATTDANYEAILSSILAAQMAQKQVRFWLAGCSGGDNKFPKITSIQLNT